MNVCAVCEFWVQGKAQNLWERIMSGAVLFILIALIFHMIWSEQSASCFVWI